MANLLFELPKGGAGPLTKSGQFGVAQVSNRFQPNATNFWNEHYLSMRFCSLSETPLAARGGMLIERQAPRYDSFCFSAARLWRNPANRRASIYTAYAQETCWPAAPLKNKKKILVIGAFL